jgi:hypothetical protein
LYSNSAHILAGDVLVETVVPWVLRALEGDKLTDFVRAAQILRSFSQHGQLFCYTYLTHLTPFKAAWVT